MKYSEPIINFAFAVVVGSVVCLVCYGMMKGTEKLSARGNYERHRTNIVTVKDTGNGKVGVSKTKR